MTEAPLQRSTESFGLGQSGYTAGRVANDYALEKHMHDRNSTYPRGVPEDSDDDGPDDRFTGRGSSHWAPEVTTPEAEHPA